MILTVGRNNLKTPASQTYVKLICFPNLANDFPVKIKSHPPLRSATLNPSKASGLQTFFDAKSKSKIKTLYILTGNTIHFEKVRTF